MYPTKKKKQKQKKKKKKKKKKRLNPSIFRKIISDETLSFTLIQRHVNYFCIAQLLKPAVKTVYKKIGHDQDWGQRFKLHKVTCLYYVPSKVFYAIVIIAVDLKVPRRFFFAPFICESAIHCY